MPHAVQIDLDTLTAQLLSHLRIELAVAALGLAEPAQRLAGGFEALTLVIRLSGEVPPSLTGPLVLRVLPEPGGARRSLAEATFQNAVAAAGFPAPAVVVAGGRRTVSGRAFNLMKHVPGRPMMQALRGVDAVGRVARQLARAHAELHDLPTAGIEESLRSTGLSGRIGVGELLREAQRYGADAALAHLRECVDWLAGNGPAEHGDRSVCHGDFHPGNVMMDAGNLTGVLDWSGPRIAHAEYDVATTLLLLDVAGPKLTGGIARDTLRTFAKAYVDAYRGHLAVDADRLRYYRALRAFRAFARGSAACAPCADPTLVPREHYPWAEHDALLSLAEVLHETTGLDVPLPRGAQR